MCYKCIVALWCHCDFVEGQRKKMKWVLYMWIILDSEALRGGVGKVLPANVSMEAGLDEDAEGTFDLDNGIATSRTKKRIRSSGESGSEGKRMAKDDEGYKQFLDRISDVVQSLSAEESPSTSVGGAGTHPMGRCLRRRPG